MIRLLQIVLLLAAVPTLFADEGMWTFDNFPAKQVQSKYGFLPTQQWLDNVRLSSLRVGNFCSGSFVSPNGLIMTNHHCARSCLQNISSLKTDYVASGFNAKSASEEQRCPALEVNVLEEIKDVTAEVVAAGQGKSGKALTDATNGAKATIEKRCGSGETTTCEVVTLYSGGRYNLYRYRRYNDLRIVFAPEEEIASFGGDPDNFNFPRYDLDFSFLRAYENDAPVRSQHYFAWSKQGLKPGDLVFMPGNPGGTSRGLTVAQLEYARDYQLPDIIAHYSEFRGLLTEFSKRGPDQEKMAGNNLFSIENSLKVYKGRRLALVDQRAFAAKVNEENILRQKIEQNSSMKAKYANAWDEIATAMKRRRQLEPEYLYLEMNRGFTSKLFGYARVLVRAAVELPKANEQRLPAFVDSELPSLRQSIASKAPIYPEYEAKTLAFSLTKLREHLGPDHPVVKQLLGTRSPEEIADNAVRNTKLIDPAIRQQIFAGGAAALQQFASDPMIILAQAVDPAARAARAAYQAEVESVLVRNGQLIGQARFAIFGSSQYPDATLTPRLSFGSVKGWQEGNKAIEPFTTMGGTFERATGADPFKLPQSWLEAKPKPRAETPFDFSATLDSTGGNSGSPIINQRAEIVGIAFDGNIHSLGGEYLYDPEMNRSVNVDARAITESLRTIYNAQRILSELQAN